ASHCSCLVFVHVTATNQHYTLSLHDALPIYTETKPAFRKGEYNSVSLLQIATSEAVYLFRVNLTGFTKELADIFSNPEILKVGIDRKSTRLNSSHVKISYAVFCLKKKNQHYK